MVMSDEEVHAVLFDMSGTLHPQTQTARAVASNLTFMKDMFHLEHSMDYISATVRAAMVAAMEHRLSQSFYLLADVYREGRRNALRELGAEVTDEELDLMLEHQRIAHAREASPQEGADELLASLRAAGIRIGIVSVNDERDLSLLVDACGLRQHLDFVLSSEAARSCKPDPAVFQLAVDLAGVPAAQTVFVGDMPEMDVVGANRAGMRSVLLMQESGYYPHFASDETASRPDYTLSHLNEFESVVLGRRSS